MSLASTCVELVLYLVKEDKDRYDITYMWNLKNAINKSIHTTESDIDIENKLTATKGER